MFLAENQSLEYTPNIDIFFWSAITFYPWFILFDSPAQTTTNHTKSHE
jgi:hypothetical protein